MYFFQYKNLFVAILNTKLWKKNSHCYYVLAYLHNRNFLELFLVRSLASFVNFLFSRSRSSWTITQSSLAPLTFTRFSVTSLYDGIFPSPNAYWIFSPIEVSILLCATGKDHKVARNAKLVSYHVLGFVSNRRIVYWTRETWTEPRFLQKWSYEVFKVWIHFLGRLKNVPTYFSVSLTHTHTHVFYGVEFHWISYQQSTKIISENNFLVGNLIKNQIFKK